MQETKTLTLPLSQKQVVIRAYTTAAIDQEVLRVSSGSQKLHYEMEIDPNVPKDIQNAPSTQPQKAVMDIDPTVRIDADNKLIELMVLTLDGDPTNLMQRLLDLPGKDFDYLKSEIKGTEEDSKLGESEKKG